MMSKSDFDKMKVNLWIAGSTDRDTNGGWCSLLHCCITGVHYTKTIGGYAFDVTPTRMTLLALLEGLKKLKKNKPIIVHIYTSVVQVSTGLNKNMYNWSKNNWLTTKGEPPLHLDLWMQIFDILTDQTRVMAYKVHLQNASTCDQPNRLQAIQTSAEYLLIGKKNLQEVSFV